MVGRGPVEQIAPEPARIDFKLEVAIRRTDEPGVDRDCVGLSDRREGLFLNHAEQFGLQGSRQFADFVEECGAAIGSAEKPNLVLEGPGKRPLCVSEENGLEKCLGDSRAVNDQKIAVGASAMAMNGAGNHFFSGAAFAGEQDVGVRGRDTFDDLE
mgnify:CR=1 FL=1